MAPENEALDGAEAEQEKLCSLNVASTDAKEMTESFGFPEEKPRVRTTAALSFWFGIFF